MLGTARHVCRANVLTVLGADASLEIDEAQMAKNLRLKRKEKELQRAITFTLAKDNYIIRIKRFIEFAKA